MISGSHVVLSAVRQCGTIASHWKNGLIVLIFREKEDRRDCNNHRSVTMHNVPGKVLAHLLLTRIHSHLLKFLPEQSGFMPDKSTTDRFLALSNLVERRREFQQGFLATYIDHKVFEHCA
ncbi:uncharacterized protein LOC143021600 [Oratosquilla oratoria]|uniref:uncharacterized protein LOC143021600 n=1 Tax=Oratosquilla oratoria TaxID=337810 RepID=UPI003F75E5E1